MPGQRPNFNGGMGGSAPPSGESMDESVVKSMMAGKQSGSGSNSNSANGNAGSNFTNHKNGSQASGSQAGGSQIDGSSNKNTPPKPIEPREVGSVKEEVARASGDVWDEVKRFFSLNAWLGIDPENINPEEEAKAKEFHARYQQLDQQQQAVAKQMYQEKMQKKKIQEEEERRKKAIEAQRKEQELSMPSSPQKGSRIQGGSKKQRAMQKLKQDRTTLSAVQGE